MSGNVFEPRALDELLPEWRSMDGHPFHTEATTDKVSFVEHDSMWSKLKEFGWNGKV